MRRTGSTPSPTASFPRRFGSYVLLEQIGTTPSTDTFLGLAGHGPDACFVTLKVGRPARGKAPDEATASRATAARRAGCPNLLTLLDAGEIDGQPFLAMEHVDGRDLARLSARARKMGLAVPLGVAAYVVREISRALNHLHLVGDRRSAAAELGPESVLISFAGEVKVVDLELGPPDQGRAGQGPQSRWHEFQAPERLADLSFDHRADVYTAGVLLWELLTLEPLFREEEMVGDNPHLVVSRETVPAPSTRRRDVPPALDAIVLQALAFDPAKRFRDAEALRAALADFVLASEPPTDAGTVALFMRSLYGDEIEDERVSRQSARTEAQWLFDADTSGKRGSEATDPLIGSVVAGRYLVQGFCGAGGIGRVYRAQHVEIGRLVALKVLDPDFTDQEEVLARFEQEARVGAIHHHPNVVQVTDAGRTKDGRRFFVMDFVDGTTLGEVLAKQGPFDIGRAVRVALEVAYALEALHAAGVIHRDINPSNVMLTARAGQPEQVKVVDFGVAKILAMADSGVFADPKSSDPRLIAGTPRYLAPEQAQGKRADARVDVYAVGELLYEMLVGRVPWHGNDVTAILRAKIDRDVLPAAMVRTDIPQELDDIITRALARDPDKRMRSVKDLRHELEAFARGAATGAGREPAKRDKEPSTLLTIRAARWPWRHLAVVVGASAFVLTLGVLAVQRPSEVPVPPPIEAGPPPASPLPRAAAPAAPTAPVVEEPAASPAPGPAPDEVDPAFGSPGSRGPSSGSLGVAVGAAQGASAAPSRAHAVPAAVTAETAAGRAEEKGSSMVAVPSAGSHPVAASSAPASAVVPEHPHAAGTRAPVEPTAAPSPVAPGSADALAASHLAQQAADALDRREYAAAMQLGQRAVALAPSVRAHVVLGQAYLMVRRIGDARREFQEAAALDPHDAEVREGLRATADDPTSGDVR